MDNKQMREDFAACVRAIEKSVRPWKIASAVLAVALAVETIALVKILFIV